jgi:hypothetical protein
MYPSRRASDVLAVVHTWLVVLFGMGFESPQVSLGYIVFLHFVKRSGLFFMFALKMFCSGDE